MIICSTPHFVHLLNQFSIKYRFPFPILVFFTVKSPSVTQRSVSRENAFKRLKESKNPSAFLRKTIGSNYSFTLIENNFRLLRYRSLNSRLPHTMAYVHSALSCDPLSAIWIPLILKFPGH